MFNGLHDHDDDNDFDGLAVWYKTKFGSQNLATKFGNHLCMATKIGSQC